MLLRSPEFLNLISDKLHLGVEEIVGLITLIFSENRDGFDTDRYISKLVQFVFLKMRSIIKESKT